jgi:TP901 family phage tail tape measure protein
MAKRIVDEEMRFTVIVNGNSAQKELFDIEKANRSLTASNKDLRAERAKLISQGKRGTEAYKQLTAEIKQNNATITANKARMEVLQQQIGVTGLSMRQLQQRASQLRLQLLNMVPGSAEYKRFQNDLREVNTQITKLKLNSRVAEGSISKLANGFSKYAALGASVIAAGTGIVLSMQKMIDYNGELSDAQSNVQKTTGLTAEAVDDLTKKFGVFSTRTSRIELLKLAEEAGRLGKDSVEDVLSFVKVANQIKVALGDDIGDEQIREVGKMVTIYKVGQKEGKNFEDAMLALGSSINEVSASGANQASFLVDFIKRTAGISDVADIAAQDMIGLAAAFDEAGQSQEISATAINKFFGSAAGDVELFAKVAGVSIKEYSRLLEEDANEALILFLKGIKEGNPTLEEMTKRLDGIELGGTRGAQAITALSANVENLEAKQKIANDALKEATSLTDEYNLKNNNLAATIDKVRKRLIGIFSSEFVINGLSNLIGKIGLLIGAVESVETAFKNETKATFESAKANQALVSEGQKLLDQYEELTADGIEPTGEAKRELDKITLQLTDRFGDSIMMIDQETGALVLNTQAVREQIKIKRLASDEEASTLASRLIGAEERRKELEKERIEAERNLELRKEIFREQNNTDFDAIRTSTSANNARLGTSAARSTIGFTETEAARQRLIDINNQINEQLEREADITEKLTELNFDAADARNLIVPDAEQPKEGDSRVVDGITFIYKNGKWIPLKAPGGGGGSGGSSTTAKAKIDQAKKEADALLKLQRETEDQRLALIQDAFLREMAINDENLVRKMEDLEANGKEILAAYDKAILSGDTDLASTLLDQYTEVLNQIELSELNHNQKRNEILQSGIENHIKSLENQYAKEEQLRQIAHNNALAELGNNEEAKQLLQEQYDRESLERQKAQEQLLIAELQKVLDTSNFEGFSLDLLSDEQLQKIKANLQELGLSLSEINALLAKMQGGSAAGDELLGIGIDANGGVDILGMTGDQWTKIFERTETLAGLIGKVGQIAMAGAQAFGMYDQFVTASENQRLQRLERNADAEVQRQDRLLANGLISRRQHDEAVKAQEDKVRKAQLEMEYKQAKRQKQMNVATILGNQAVAVSKALAQGGFVLGIPWAGIVATFAGLQLAAALAQPLPAKGFEKGYYGNTMAVRREQDGKLFNAGFGGQSRSGVVDKPTVFLAGEGGKNFPELIINGPDLKQFNPDLKNSLYRELGRIRGFESGYYPDNPQPGGSGDDGTKAMMISVLNRTADILERIEADGIEAYLPRNFTNAKRMREDIKKLDTLENKSKINT